MEELLTRFTFSIVLCSRLYWFLIEFVGLLPFVLYYCHSYISCLFVDSRMSIILFTWHFDNKLLAQA